MHTTSGYIPIRGSRIFFETTGEGEPVLLLHGGLGTIDDFASQRPTLAGCFKVVAFERPGHGHTADIAEPFSFAAMLGYTIDFIEASTLGPVNLVGWSDGAILSLLLAISRPDLLKRMVCVSGNFDTSFYTAGTLERFRSATLESFGRDQAKLLRRYDDISPDGPVHFSVVLEKTITMWSREPNITREELAKIKAPTLVMSGDSDVIPLDHTVTLFRSIKGAELCVIPGATHFLLSERPEATTRAILDFLLDEES
jgi:pimeloyl-ACP methyl ester carboxylesterase